MPDPLDEDALAAEPASRCGHGPPVELGVLHPEGAQRPAAVTGLDAGLAPRRRPPIPTPACGSRRGGRRAGGAARAGEEPDDEGGADQVGDRVGHRDVVELALLLLLGDVEPVDRVAGGADDRRLGERPGQHPGRGAAVVVEQLAPP